MSIKNNFLKTTLALAVSLSLSGCFSDGDDGAQGPQGPQGEVGAPGADGQDAPTGISLSLVGRTELNPGNPLGAAEIVQYHAASNTIFAINNAVGTPSLGMVDISSLPSSAIDNPLTANNLNATSLSLETTANGIALGGPTSIAVYGDMLAVAVPAAAHNETGAVLFYTSLESGSPEFVKAVAVGYLPDMVTFTPDGSKVLVANEGEPAGDYSFDPEGSVSVISIADGVPADTATEINFQDYNGAQAMLEEQGMHFPNPNGRIINDNLVSVSVAQDLEPEYITATNTKAYVTLQENNGLAIIDLESNSVEIVGLGFKDWSLWQLDGTEDGRVSFGQYQDVYGVYQPDSIASYQWSGADFLITANEGDAREYYFDTLDEQGVQNEELCIFAGGQSFDQERGCLSYSEEVKAQELDYVFDSNLGRIANGNPADVDFAAFQLGDLRVTSVLGDQNGDGVQDAIFAYGGRSFTIWDQNGLPVFDSGDDFERITASVHGRAFNNEGGENAGDSRSANKGPEPEALAVGQVGERTYAFIGLERMGGIFVYDVTNPYDTNFVDYIINRDTTEGADALGDLAPEGMTFVPAADSPSGNALLVVGNEVSGSVSVWQIAEQ
ncbi:choice-of-anchor I family protein [Alteromonas sp. a30]|uniref:choice-of-anchor I family protein n=1 Tax=Alteromonas sp. a30 TaxID=2730917 RepID=UPI00228258F6|nr:choice-of-anchor I family protein [Alteromonas sp. a30]MCY7296110.1 collagen-like protein [Alteromonas sp. a30]